MDIKTHNRLNFYFLLLFLLCLQFNNSTLLSFNEGDNAEMVFQYHDLNTSDVSLHVSNRPMFYHSGNMSLAGLTPKQHGRFSVHEGTHKGDNSHKSIHMIRLTIINVTREDAGTFISEIRQNGEKQDKLTRKIGLQVEFPPGRATCEIEGSFGEMNGVWIRVNCRAPVGSLQGYIDCYQDGEKMPPWTRPVQDRTTVKQTLWIKRANPVHCCTSNYERPTDRCSCKDFGWDPDTGSIPQDKIDPCQITQVETYSEQTSTKSQGSHSSASNQPLTHIHVSTTTVSHGEGDSIDGPTDSILWGVMVAVIGVLLLIISYLLACLFKSKNYKKEKVTYKAQLSKEEAGESKLLMNPIATEDIVISTHKAVQEKKRKEELYTKQRLPGGKKT